MSNIIQNTMVRVSDIITNENIKSWDNKCETHAVTIKAGCGRGKSYFIKNNLYKAAKAEGKKILMLIHRSNCVQQFDEEIKSDVKTDVIDIKTYQSIEYHLLRKNSIDLRKYKYIVADEFHYFLDDAGFNRNTDISFEYILKQNQSVKIFMSAICENMIKYINNICKIETIDYAIEDNFSHIEALTFFHKDNTLEQFIEEGIRNNDKAIFFIQSAEKAYRLFKKYQEHCLFNCSKSNKKYYKYVDAGKVDTMLREQRFEERFLITTQSFDAGSNIVDEEVKHIVCDITDTSSLIQCLGRRRILRPQDKIKLYVKVINNQRLGGLESTMKNKIKMADYLYSHSVAEFIEAYPRQQDYSGIIYDDMASEENDTCIKKVNQLMYLKKKYDIAEFQIIKKLGEFGYCKYLAHMFGFYDEATNRYTYRTIKEDDSLELYLENQVGKKMLQVKDRKELISELNVRSNGKQLKSRKSLNAALEERGINYKIIQTKTSQMINGKQKKYDNVWIVQRLKTN